mmetsp:Transcript_12391/g.12436  ORF Transcript_12391/g.12436 Transcript_12391/m.12436 type:complete len:156 (-) Transcript_12391:283-750(-)
MEDSERSGSFVRKNVNRLVQNRLSQLAPLTRKNRQEASKSMVDHPLQNSNLQNPISLIDRRYNNLSKLTYRKAQRDLSFPMNPAFINDPKFESQPPLQDLITFCSNNSISFSPEENRFYNISNSKKNHRLWKQALNKLYDTNEKDIVDAIVEFLK